MKDPEEEAIADAYAAWLNEAVRLRTAMLARGWKIPFTMANLWRTPEEVWALEPNGVGHRDVKPEKEK